MSFNKKATRDAVDQLNAMLNLDQVELSKSGFTGRKRMRNSLRYWNPTKGWKGTVYIFGYTPWRTEKDGKSGFFAVKYRVLKGGVWKLVKSVRFGRRKVAKARALKWHNKYYHPKEEEVVNNE